MAAQGSIEGKSRNNTKCPSEHGCINKMWFYPHKGILFSFEKENGYRL